MCDVALSEVTTFAGVTYAYSDGIGLAARFKVPIGVAVDNSCGCIIVADSDDQRIRILTPLAGIIRLSVALGQCSR